MNNFNKQISVITRNCQALPSRVRDWFPQFFPMARSSFPGEVRVARLLAGLGPPERLSRVTWPESLRLGLHTDSGLAGLGMESVTLLF